jgi:two-component system sensor histidine kinase/response regulator
MEATRVLVVDDHPQNVELLEAYLIPEGYDVITAFDGLEALEKVAESPPDIVLLDVMMPRMDGYEVCRQMKDDEATRFIPIVMVTALKELEDKIKSIEAGADDFLTKPIVKIEMLTRIKSLIRVKRLHDDLEKSYSELKELERTKENLTQMIIHDLKNPLTGIKANLEIVGMDDLGDTQECLDAAQRSADLLYYMIQDLLDISKLEENKLNLIREDVVVEELCATTMGEVEAPAHAEDKEVKLDIASDVPAVSMDRTLIYRVISNLLLNAIKHTGRGGSITLRATVDGQEVTIAVADNGHGIPSQYLETIFEKFGQVETRQRTGTGLGLTFCKMAVEAHGGQISVESVEGEGSTFTFTLPISAA